MSYNPKKVAELIANRKEAELGKALQPRLRKIAEIVSTVKYGFDIKGTVGHFFAHYVSSGAYKDRDKETFSIHCESEGLRVFYCDEYFLPIDSTMVPMEFATCEDKDLKGVVITQIRDDLYRYVNKLEKEFNKARNIRNKFTVEYDEFINTNEENDAKEGK